MQEVLGSNPALGSLRVSPLHVWRDKQPEINGLRLPEHHAGHSIRAKMTPPSQNKIYNNQKVCVSMTACVTPDGAARAERQERRNVDKPVNIYIYICREREMLHNDVCICVCMYIYIHTYIHTFIHRYICIYIYV